ncbi:RraA family protein [Oscillibacter hominis]|uniref:Putative 4-hydroxy-4-methyl-2-oxoglutarate aldolase n=1 Tax=Oscillibacter hominis TaxID=2763056 RepID=A0A7G9B507_9FIRM|nr:RraA family protein [Oscillibacter hominis]QNL44638.1 RraA family protein [Oscillibacter hominis]
MDKLVERLRALDTTCVSDALDKMGVPCALLDIKPVLPGKKICGRAFTVHYVPCGQVKGTVGDFLDDVQPGQVVVIDNAGRDYCTVWGDIMAVTAKLRGVEGTVIDGVCRDIPAVRESGYPMFTKGWYMATGKDRVEVDAVNVPVAVSGVKVCPGDILLGDDTGVVAIPQERAEEAAAIAEDIDRKEAAIIALVKEGKSLKEARQLTGYHHLQTKPAE